MLELVLVIFNDELVLCVCCWLLCNDFGNEILVVLVVVEYECLGWLEEGIVFLDDWSVWYFSFIVFEVL